MRILFHKKRPGKDIENWPILVLFKGFIINTPFMFLMVKENKCDMLVLAQPKFLQFT